MDKKLKIAMVVPDNRDEFRRYNAPPPHFGTAPTALRNGFTQLADECEVHVVNCVQQPVKVPEMIGSNIYYHTEIVPKWGWLRGAYVGCIRSIRRQLQKTQPDIVHGQGTERYCSLAAMFSGFPNVLTIHGNMRLIARVNHSRPFSFQWLAAQAGRIYFAAHGRRGLHHPLHAGRGARAGPENLGAAQRGKPGLLFGAVLARSGGAAHHFVRERYLPAQKSKQLHPGDGFAGPAKKIQGGFSGADR